MFSCSRYLAQRKISRALEVRCALAVRGYAYATAVAPLASGSVSSRPLLAGAVDCTLNLASFCVSSQASQRRHQSWRRQQRIEQQLKDVVDVPPKQYQAVSLFVLTRDTPWERLEEESKGVRVVQYGDNQLLEVDPWVLESITAKGVCDIEHLFRPDHLRKVAKILRDPEASENDRFVAMELLKNACVSANGILPSCQDTGTVSIVAHRGHQILTDGNDQEYLAKGVYNVFQEKNYRYSQMAPLSFFAEKNTKTNLPAQIEIFTRKGMEYHFLIVAKGGGSANKTRLIQKTKATLNDAAFESFIENEVLSFLGTTACPPYHLAVVVGGLSAEQCLKTVKLASTKALDGLPLTGSEEGRAFRDLTWEEKIKFKAQAIGIGAQFGGKYFLHDVRVIRLPRHGASLPIGIGVSCSADRQVLCRITQDGVFMEKLETEPEKYLPSVSAVSETQDDPIHIDLNMPMNNMLKELSKHPVSTRVLLTGSLIVARDAAHARLRKVLNKDGVLPEYMKDFPVYYAGPAKTPEGMPSGSFGPTTSARMDPYVAEFLAAGGSMVMIGKGNRTKECARACKKYGGFYLGSIGGVAAQLTQSSITHVETLDMAELGMEAIWKIQVQNFPAFIIIDDKGNDFYDKLIARAAEQDDDYYEELSGLVELFEDFIDIVRIEEGNLNTERVLLTANDLGSPLGISEEECTSLLAQFDDPPRTPGKPSVDCDEFINMLRTYPQYHARLDRYARWKRGSIDFPEY